MEIIIPFFIPLYTQKAIQYIPGMSVLLLNDFSGVGFNLLDLINRTMHVLYNILTFIKWLKMSLLLWLFLFYVIKNVFFSMFLSLYLSVDLNKSI